jgi:cytochrome P450
MLTTMLSVTNTTAAPGLERFDPAHYDGRRLAGNVAVATKEMVSTFGHGTHACPAARFSISAIRTGVRRLLDTYELEVAFGTPAARRRQIGGVARAERPLLVRYRARS